MKTLAQAEDYLHQFIQSRLVPGPIFLERTKYFLRLVGSPQNKIRVIHVAGTSGKSSTASFISALLTNQGFKTGLQLSPHLYDIRERMQINHTFIPKSLFVSSVKKLKPFIEQMKESPHGTPSYFEITVVMAYLFFYEQQVDYAVIETGLGGITDPTNSVQSENKVCVLTKIGFDHMEILGNTLREISYNKAGIIQSGNHAFTYYQNDEITEVYINQARKKKADLHILRPSDIYHISRTAPTGTVFRSLGGSTRGETYDTSLVGSFQIENLTLALQAVDFLHSRDGWGIDMTRLRSTIESVQIPGRVQRIQAPNGNHFLIDTAHNEQKIDALLQTIKRTYPQKRFLFVVAFKKGKDYKRMIEQIAHVAEKIIITRFLKENQDMVHISVPAEDISYELNKRGYQSYDICEDTQQALNTALSQTELLPVITGSLYFVGDLYERYTSHI